DRSDKSDNPAKGVDHTASGYQGGHVAREIEIEPRAFVGFSFAQNQLKEMNGRKHEQRNSDRQGKQAGFERPTERGADRIRGYGDQEKTEEQAAATHEPLLCCVDGDSGYRDRQS